MSNWSPKYLYRVGNWVRRLAESEGDVRILTECLKIAVSEHMQ